MKKLILIAASLASMFLAGSCQRENLEPAATGKSVTFNVEAPAALQTKAIADGLNVDELIYEVYLTEVKGQTDLADAVKLYQGKVRMTKVEDRYASSGYINTAEVTVELLQDQHYTVLFWAQVAETGAYNTTNLTAVKYNKAYGENDTQYNANDESLAAFYAVEYITDGDPAVKDVTLRRPFAQLNLGTTNAKANNDGTYTIALDQSKVKVENVPTAFNVATSDVSVPATMYFKMYDVPAKSDVEADKTLKVNDKPYQYAGMNYLFASNDNTVTVTYDIQANLTTKDGAVKTATVNNTVTNVPLKENHRTNIIGNLLTSQTEYEVVVDANFEEPAEVFAVWDGSSVSEPAVETDTNTGERVYVVDEASDLAWLAQMVNGPLTRAAAVDSYDFKLEADIDLGNYPWTPIGYNPNEEAGNEKYFTGTFDGNGHTIKNLYIDVKDKGGVGFFGAIHNATIKDITFENVFVKAVESENDPANTSGAQDKPNYIVGGHMGAVAGYDAKAGEITFKNVHVKGLVKIEGETRAAQGQRIGGIFGGKSSSNVTFENVSVKGTEGSYIKGYCSTAGVSGQIQGVATYDNVQTDIDVYAVTFGAGGIAGIVRHGSTFNNCSSAGDITLDASRTQLSSYSANYPYRVGGIAGCWSEGGKTGVLTLTDCSYTGTLTSIDKDGNSPEAFDYAGYVGRGYTLKGCAGSKVSINGVEYVQVYDKAADAGLYYVNGEYTVASAANLKLVADKVNTGVDYFEGTTIKLGADIDLNNQEWTPIGSAAKDHGFMGNFDGNGKTIKNLNITNNSLTPDSDNYVYAGLFGVTEGTETQENYIKNLAIENVTIETTGHIAAAAIAYPYYTTVENITVRGNINIKGGDYTSGALAYTRRCVNAKDITVSGNEGSLIEGNSTVGGVISDIQMNGGLTAKYSNFSALGLTIKGTKCVGGISGIISYQTLDGATVKNVTLVCNDNRTGIVAGADGGKSTLKNVSYEKVEGATRVIGATYDGGLIPVATADELIAAMGSGNGIILSEDVVLTEDWTPVGTIDNPFNGVVNGNNHKISGLKVAETDYAAFIAYAGKDAVIKNLTLENVDITSTKHAAGVVCQASEGITIENVTVSGTIVAPSYAGGLLHNVANAVIKNCVNNANVSANRAGGIASWVTVNATIENVENNGTIEGAVGASGIAHGFAGNIKYAVNNGNVTSNEQEAAAGIVGVQKAASTYEYCYNYGNVTSTFDNPNSSASGILGQSAGSTSTIKYCANYGNVTAEASYAAGIAYSLYGTINALYCYNEGAISGADGAGAIAPKAQYGKTDKASYCLNAGTITSSNGTIYQGSNNNVSSYYYDGTTLKNVADKSDVAEADALVILNGGSDNDFFSTENGKITVK